MNREYYENMKAAEAGVYYTPAKVIEWLNVAAPKQPPKCKKRGQDFQLYNVTAAFDIETTTINDDPAEPVATMYAWMFGLNGAVMVGRTWKELSYVMSTMKTRMKLSESLMLPVFVHNLSFDFQFLRKHRDWSDVFALEELKPMYANSDGFHFRCSYILTGKSLEECGKDLLTYPVAKKVGDLDYSLKRHTKTPLTPEEIGYCINDVLVVMSTIQERIDTEGTVSKIPLTKTGYARRECRSNCLYPQVSNGQMDMKAFKTYRRTMEALTMTHAEYVLAKRAFAGGFTHANAWYVGEVQKNITSYDFTSSYPAVMVCKLYPMSRGFVVDTSNWSKYQRKYRESLEHYCKTYNCIMDITIDGLAEDFTHDHYISESRCQEITGEVTDNGRVVSAKRVRLACTELDYDIIKRTYTYKKVTVNRMMVYYKRYLPKDFILTILSLYEKKTKLKGVEGMEAEYQRAKELLNALYGMCVTDICKDDIIYDGEWDKVKLKDFESVEAYNAMRGEKVEDYNKSDSRFLSYLWGVYVAAHARHNLWEGILECGDDYRYSDTDSLKIANADAHMDFINSYNERIGEEMEKVCRHYNIDVEMTRPKTIKGEVKPLGVWDFDGHYTRFKTLGAKRYLVETDNGEMTMTVAGVNKNNAMAYLRTKYKTNDKIFAGFSDGMTIPGENDLGVTIYDKKGNVVDNPSGKLIHKYIHHHTQGELTDYLGNTEAWEECSSVALTPTSYSLGLSGEFADFLLCLRETDV